MGLSNYAMFLLIATYGLRASEVVAITLDDIHWRQGILRIYQRKTSSPLELPLTNEVLSALVQHLKRTPPPAPYRRVFLRMRAPMGVLKPTAVTEAFQALVRKSGLAPRRLPDVPGSEVQEECRRRVNYSGLGAAVAHRVSRPPARRSGEGQPRRL